MKKKIMIIIIVLLVIFGIYNGYKLVIEKNKLKDDKSIEETK